MKNKVPQIKASKKRQSNGSEWYSLRSMLGYSWSFFLFLLGGREAGKSYAVTDFYVRQFKKYGRPFYWMRLTDTSQKKLLMNNAEKLIDPDLRRKYNLDLEVVGDAVYNVTYKEIDTGKLDEEGNKIFKKKKEKKLIARVMALSTFYNDKGSGLFDKDFLLDPKMYYNICLDEMNREKNEKKTFDIVYSFVNQLENLVRSTKKRIRVICIGNTLEEASDILCAFNFVPEDFGRYKLKKKRCVIDYIEPSEEYKARRKGTIADIIAGDQSTFTNQIDVDTTLVKKCRLSKPDMIIRFGTSKSQWFTVWDSNVIAKYNGENCKTVVPMRPYLDCVFVVEQRDRIIELFDTRCFYFHNLITQKTFKKELELLKPRKG